MNDDLLKPFTMDEVESTLFQMCPYKVSGPNGYNACFYQDHWFATGDEVNKVVLSFSKTELHLFGYDTKE